MSEADTVQGSG